MKAYLVDAFTENRFEGNSAGVVLEGQRYSATDKQKIAAEIKASETAFISKSNVADWLVEFFTPTAPIDFCGHATVATFYILAKEGLLTFQDGVAHSSEETKAGTIPMVVRKANDGKISIEMTQRKLQSADLESTAEELALALKIDVAQLDTRYPIAKSNTGNWHAMIGVNSRDVLNSIEYDAGLLSQILIRAGCVTAHVFSADAANSMTYHARNFCPHIGIPEDPATGSAAGAFIGYLAAHKLLEGDSIVILQGEQMGRPSKIFASFDPEKQQPVVRGHAVASFVLVDPG